MAKAVGSGKDGKPGLLWVQIWQNDRRSRSRNQYAGCTAAALGLGGVII